MTDVPRYNPHVGSFIGLYDADTFFIDYVVNELDRVHIIKAIPELGPKLKTRLARVQADEMTTESGRLVTQKLLDYLGPLPRTVYTFSTRRDFYTPDNFGGRIDAEVQLADTGVFISDWLLENGLAKPYKH